MPGSWASGCVSPPTGRCCPGGDRSCPACTRSAYPSTASRETTAPAAWRNIFPACGISAAGPRRRGLCVPCACGTSAGGTAATVRCWPSWGNSWAGTCCLSPRTAGGTGGFPRIFSWSRRKNLIGRTRRLRRAARSSATGCGSSWLFCATARRCPAAWTERDAWPWGICLTSRWRRFWHRHGRRPSGRASPAAVRRRSCAARF